MNTMKRGASNQLTKDHPDDEEIEESNTSSGFQKADESVLATRQIKSLPKRGNVVAATFDAPGSENKLNSGAGLQSSGPPSSSSFTFTAPSSAPTLPASQPSPTNASYKFSESAVSSSASSASKQLSSLLGSAPQPNGSHTSAPPAKPTTTTKDSAETKFFSSLRGLNEALRAEVAKLLDSDPFVDLGGALDVYNGFRATIQKEFEDSQKSQGTPLTNGTSSTSTSSSKAGSDAPQTPAAPSLPNPPATFAAFGAPSATSAPSTSIPPAPAAGGFKPNFDAMPSTSAASSLFSFGTSSATSEKTTPAPSPFMLPSSSASNAKSSPFGTSEASTKQSVFGDTSIGSSSFGLANLNKADKQPISFGSGSVFGGASFSGQSDASSSATAAPSNIFGGSGTSGSTSTPTFGGISSGSNTFGFGGARSPSGNLGNPVGFSFGGNAPTPNPESSTGTASGLFPSASKTTAVFGSSSSAPSGFAFDSGTAPSATGSQDASGASAKSSTPASISSSPDSRADTPVSADGGEMAAPKVLGENPNDLEGEGEEGENTVYTSKVKIYKFWKEENNPHWTEVGVGMLRIKKHKESGSLRLLSRNSTNGRVMMNFKLYSGFKVTRAKQVLNFVGHDSGSNVTFRVRVKDEAAAIALQEAIEKEVSSL